MKKLLSFILAAAMLSALLYVPAAAATTPAPVFSMDISDYTDTNQVVKNGVTGKSDGIKVLKYTTNTDSGGPVKMTQAKSNGGTISYLSFSTTENVVAENKTAAGNSAFLGNVVISPEQMTSLLKSNYDDMAVEFWVRSYDNWSTAADGEKKVIDSAVFSYGREHFTGQTFMTGGIESGKVTMYPIGKGTTYTLSDNTLKSTGENRKTDSFDSSCEWTHYVVTRDWTESSTPKVGDFSSIAVYKNGRQIYSNSTSWSVRNKDDDGTSLSMWSFAIGGWQNYQAGTASAAFDGAIAEFRIYNQHITADEAKALYDVNSALYTAEDVTSWSGAAATLGSTTDVSADAQGMTLRFSEAMDVTRFDKIVLKNEKTKKAVPIRPGTYDADTNSLEVSFLEYLDEDTEYSFSFAGVKDAAGGYMQPTGSGYTFKTASGLALNSVTFYNQSDAVITGISGAAEVKAVIDAENRQAQAQDYAVYLAYYDGFGVLQKIAPAAVSGVQQNQKLLSADGTSPLSVRLTGLAPVSGSKIRCFIFNTTSGGLSPVGTLYTEIKY